MRKTFNLAVAERRQPSAHKDFISPSPALTSTAPSVIATGGGTPSGCAKDPPETCHNYDESTPAAIFSGQMFSADFDIRRPRHHSFGGTVENPANYDRFTLDENPSFLGVDWNSSGGQILALHGYFPESFSENPVHHELWSAHIELMMNRDNKQPSQFTTPTGQIPNGWRISGQLTWNEMSRLTSMIMFCYEGEVTDDPFFTNANLWWLHDPTEPKTPFLWHDGLFSAVLFRAHGPDPWQGSAQAEIEIQHSGNIANAFNTTQVWELGILYNFSIVMLGTSTTVKVWKEGQSEAEATTVVCTFGSGVDVEKPQFGIWVLGGGWGGFYADGYPADYYPGDTRITISNLRLEFVVGISTQTFHAFGYYPSTSGERYAEDCDTFITPKSGSLMSHSLKKEGDKYAPSLGADIIRSYEEVFVNGFKTTDWSEVDLDGSRYVTFPTDHGDATVTSNFRIL